MLGEVISTRTFVFYTYIPVRPVCAVASLPDYRSVVVISHRHKCKYRSSIAISISLLLPPPVIHPNPPIRAEQMTTWGAWVIGRPLSLATRTARLGGFVFDEVDTQLPLLLPLRRRVARERGRRAGPENTREVTSGVQRLSSACMQCSLAVHSFTYWCGARQTAINHQPVNAVPSTKQRSIARRRRALRQGGQGPGTRDQGPGPFAVPVSSCRSAPDLFGRKMNHTTAHPLPLPPCHPIPHPSLPVKCSRHADSQDSTSSDNLR